MLVDIVTLPHFEGLSLPAYETADSAGMDLRCAVHETILLEPMERRAVPTGISIALPSGYEAQIRPRSGLSLKQGIGVVNAPGTIDADYRGEILVPLINFSKVVVEITRGMRVAQMIVAPVLQIKWRQVENLSQSERGDGGFGHTGVV